MPVTYTKLTGKMRDIAGFRQMWLADDHLLLVQSSRFSEHYRKFALKDIQAIVVTAAPPAIVYRVVMVVLAIIFAWIGFLVSSIGARSVFGALAAIPIGFLIADFVLGPRCRCRLCTEVSSEPIPVRRRAEADRMMFQLIPALTRVQGPLAVTPPDESMPAFMPRPVVDTRTGIQDSTTAIRLFPSLCGLLLVNATLLIIGFLVKNMELMVAFTSFLLGEVLMGFLLYRAVRNMDREWMGRAFGVLTMALSSVDFVGGIAIFVDYVIRVAEASKAGNPQPGWSSLPYLAVWVYYAVGWRALLGVGGAIRFVAMRLSKSNSEGGDTSPA